MNRSLLKGLAIGRMGRRSTTDYEPPGLHPVQASEQCTHPEHDPPRMIEVPAGHKWVHYCPQCNRKSVVYSSHLSL